MWEQLQAWGPWAPLVWRRRARAGRVLLPPVALAVRLVWVLVERLIWVPGVLPGLSARERPALWVVWV